MGARSNTCCTRTSRWWAQGTGGQKRLWIPTAGRIHFIWIVCRTRHPALSSFQILKSTQITFWLIWNINFGQDLTNLWKTTQPLTYSRIIKKELNAYMHVYAQTHTQTHTHTHTHTPKPCSELRGCELHRMVSGAPSPDLSLKLFMDVRKPDWVRNFLSSFSLVHLQCTSSWHFQSGLALTKTISCFALKKWITWNGNLAAKPWKIVPGPNICPKWAQLRSPWRSRRGAWRERAWKREKKTMERLSLLMSEVLCDRHHTVQLPYSAPHPRKTHWMCPQLLPRPLSHFQYLVLLRWSLTECQETTPTGLHSLHPANGLHAVIWIVK